MDSVVLKIILLVVMGIVPVVFGLMPLKIYSRLTSGHKGQMSRTSATVISLISCYCGGVMLGVCLMHLLPRGKRSSRTLV
ncbi:hypothetical protein M3Y97_00554100 [Aphelenchoides bicaudatus]|nr:hypothetical protein M3Y97_00554100 [Aphelenchoides bicaudatus]